MLAIALLAVLLALCVQAWGLAVAFAVPASACLIRATGLARRPSAGPPSTFDSLATFLMTFVLAVVILIAGGIAFLVTCLGVVSNSPMPNRSTVSLDSGVVCGVIAAGVTAASLILLFLRVARKGPH